VRCPSVRESIERIVTPVFERVLGEKISSSVCVLWRPNNYRRRVRVSPKTKELIRRVKSVYGKDCKYYGCNNLLMVRVRGCSLLFHKSWLECVFSSGTVFRVWGENVGELESVILGKVEQIRVVMDEIIRDFCEGFGVGVFGGVEWCRFEDWLKGDKFVDSLPKDCVLHDTYFKKVYAEGVEFKSTKDEKVPGVFLKNFIKNRCLEDKYEDIMSEIKGQRTIIRELMGVNREFSKNLVLHLSVLKGIDKSFRRFDKLLSQKKLKDWL